MPLPLGPLIGFAATALGGGLAYGAANKQIKEQKKQRKLQEKLAGGNVSCKNGTCSARPSAQNQMNPNGASPIQTAGGEGNAWTGYSPGVSQLQRFTPQQQAAQNQLLQQGLAGLNPEAAQKEQYKNFYSNIVPTLAERFTSMGAGGQDSSDFRGAIGAAGVDLQDRLNALQHQSALAMLGYGLQPSFESIYKPGEQGILQSGATAAAPYAAQLAGNLLSTGAGKLWDYFTAPGSTPSTTSNLLGGNKASDAFQYQGVPNGFNIPTTDLRSRLGIY